ncbi:MAG: AAA family ATPase [Mycobacterium sp.]
MRLHRLVLTNYRGIVHRDIQLPDSGVVVICGANEVGKTSMIEALDLLLDSKDRSTKKEVKQVKPTHADLGAEVLAEISTGRYRFTYRKRFHKKCETELTIVEPRREQLTGDEAHERVLAMLAETVDKDLWRAQRLLQATSTSAVDLSGCDALSRALDLAAGDAAALSGNEPLLIERIDAEYARYFTSTGRRTGEWAAATSALSSAEEELARCRAAVVEIDDRVRRHAEATRDLAALGDDEPAIKSRLEAAEQAVSALARLTEDLDVAKLRAEGARAASAASASVHAERSRLNDEIAKRIATIEELKADVDCSRAAETSARMAADAAAARAAQTTAESEAAQLRLERSRRIVESCAARDEANRLAARMSRIEAAQRDLDDITGQLAELSLTPDVMADIESASRSVAGLESQLALTTATVEFTAATDIGLVVGGEQVRLAAGETWSPQQVTSTTVELPGLLTIRIDPGVNAAELQEKLTAAKAHEAHTLARGGAPDVVAARSIFQRRNEISHRRDQTAATLAGLTAGEEIEQLRQRLTGLRGVEAGCREQLHSELQLESVQADLIEATESASRLHSEVLAQQTIVTQTQAEFLEKSTLATVLADRLNSEEQQLRILEDRRAVQRAEFEDDQVAARAAADAAAAAHAAAIVDDMEQRRAAANPTAIDSEWAEARADAERLAGSRSELERVLNDISVELAVMGDDGRNSSLDAAQSAHEHAVAQYSRIEDRARSVQTLRTVFTRHRDDTRLRYVEPFRAEIEKIGKPVFGPTFEVDVDPDLRVCSRTLDGRTVPFESLSSGAREQLGILARLAGAALVAKEDSVPVVLDDALGFSDPDRLDKMADVFNAVGDRGQLIVLTCTPNRYLGVDAHFIELTPN